MRSIVRPGGRVSIKEPGGHATARSVQRSDQAVLPAFFPTLEATYEATLGHGAWSRIKEEISAIRRSSGPALETAGWLLAYRHSPDRIVYSTSPGEKALLSPSSVKLDPEHILEIERCYPHLQLVGDWHLHASGGSTPSEQDRRSWAHAAREITGSYWLSVIATPGRAGTRNRGCTAGTQTGLSPSR